MMNRDECREIRQALGVYVLGAIDPAERALVDAHLAGCPECRENLADLAGLPALLHRVPAAEARQLAGDGPRLLAPPPEYLLRSLLDRAAGVRRQRRWRTAAAVAAAVVLALGAGAGGAAALSGATGAPAPPAAGRSTAETASGSAAAGIHLTVRYAPAVWGTTMSVRVSGVPDGTVCQFRVVDAAGRATVAGSWRVSYGHENAWYPLSSAVTVRDVRGFQVTGNGKVLVSAAVR